MSGWPSSTGNSIGSPYTSRDDAKTTRRNALDFDNLAGYLAYRENAEHQKIVETFVQPIVGARGAVQYEI